MGFTVRFMLGTLLVLLCSCSIQPAHLPRSVRASDHGDGKTADKLQKIETENTTQQSIIANLSEDNKPKTDSSTEDNKTIDKQNSVVGKLQKSESYNGEKKEEVKTIGRSIDIEKYVSNDFHNKHNVYRLPASPDTEKFLDHDYDFHHASTRAHYDQFNYDSELTTPKSKIFDHKYKEAVESVDQKLEHIDDAHEGSSESESKESINLEKLYDETKKNDTKADLNYINYKNIISNDTTGKNSLHKDLVVEAGTNLDFRSSYNHTTVIDENDGVAKEPKVETSTLSNIIPDQGDLDNAESFTSKSIILTTRKSVVVTKPPNSSHISILSNNIESETVKAINPTTETRKGEKEVVGEVLPKEAPIEISKRRFTLTTEPSTNTINKSLEQVQENQVIPIHVEPSSSSIESPPIEKVNHTVIETVSKVDNATEASPVEKVNQLVTVTTESEIEKIALPGTTTTTTTTTETSKVDTATESEIEKTALPGTTTTTTETSKVDIATESEIEKIALPGTTTTTTEKSKVDTATESEIEKIALPGTTTTTTETNKVYTTTDSEIEKITLPGTTTPTTTTEIISEVATTTESEIEKIALPETTTTENISKVVTSTESETENIALPETTTITPIPETTTSTPETTTSLPETTIATKSPTVSTTTIPPTEATSTLPTTTNSPVISTTTFSPTEPTTSLPLTEKDVTTIFPKQTETETRTSIITETSTTPWEKVTAKLTETTTTDPETTSIVDQTTLFASTFQADGTASPTTELIPTTDFPDTTTTENPSRTSKGMVFKIITITALPMTEIPATEPAESTTEAVVETTAVLVVNRTRLVPEMKQAGKTTTEAPTTTESNAVSSDFYEHPDDDNGGTIAAITISSIGAVCLILLAGLLVIMRKRQKRFNYGQRCTPVSLDDYSMDNVSVHNSVRRKGMIRGSKRSYGNPAFEDPVSVTHPLNFPALGRFANNLEDMKAEYEEIPQITARTNELPEGCDTKNRYANVIPLPETRVFLALIDGYPNSDYINANYVTGPKNTKGYYIACQAPMQNTVDDFWRMIWEQQSKVVLMLTHLFENGIEKCVDYLPPSEVLDCHRLFGDFQVTLKKQEVKDKYIISSLQLKNMVSNSWREVTHFWYLGWPEKSVPAEANSLIAFLIEARSYMKSSSLDRKENLTNGMTKNDLNPVVVHCSPGTGRTGVVIACDIAIREFEQTRLVDVPRIVYKIRRDRASAVQTKEQYAFIYKVINLYATKLTGGALDSL